MSEPEPAASPPLIVTLLFDAKAQAFFDAQRERYFPPARNHLAAHLTLFHALPAAQQEAVEAALAAAVAGQAALRLEVAELRSLGRGVAYRLVCPALLALHRTLAKQFAPWLTAQDAQSLWPHVTVQGKASPAAAQALLAELQRDFQPFDCRGVALGLWRYLGGPWAPLGRYAFEGLGDDVAADSSAVRC